MTLVVARLVAGTVRIISDTRLTPRMIYGNNRGIGPVYGALKIVILNSQDCVAYAGVDAQARQAIRMVQRLPDAQQAGCVALALFECHETGGRDVDYIIAGADPPQLHRVVNGELQLDLTNAWIGDPFAFRVYQAAFHTIPGFSYPSDMFSQEETELFTIAGKMSDAFRTVIDDPACATVDDLQTTAVSRSSSGNGFRYLPMAAGFDFQPVVSTPGRTSLTRPKGPAHGGYNYVVIVPDQPGIAAIGVWILQGSFGILYHPLLLDEPRIYHNCTNDGFVDRVISDYGLLLTGILLR